MYLPFPALGELFDPCHISLAQHLSQETSELDELVNATVQYQVSVTQVNSAEKSVKKKVVMR